MQYVLANLGTWILNGYLKFSIQLADFSRMQPAQPNPYVILFIIVAKMIGVAGAKEAELQGASSFSGLSPWAKASMGDGAWKPNEKLDATRDET
jgi:hypothetical protein